MLFRIHYNGNYEDAINIYGKTLDEIRIKAQQETSARGWEIENCWSEKLED